MLATPSGPTTATSTVEPPLVAPTRDNTPSVGKYTYVGVSPASAITPPRSNGTSSEALSRIADSDGSRPVRMAFAVVVATMSSFGSPPNPPSAGSAVAGIQQS